MCMTRVHLGCVFHITIGLYTLSYIQVMCLRYFTRKSTMNLSSIRRMHDLLVKDNEFLGIYEYNLDAITMDNRHLRLYWPSDSRSYVHGRNQTNQEHRYANWVYMVLTDGLRSRQKICYLYTNKILCVFLSFSGFEIRLYTHPSFEGVTVNAYVRYEDYFRRTRTKVHDTCLVNV